MKEKTGVSTEPRSFQSSHLAFLEAGRASSFPSDGRGFFTVEIIPKAVFLVSTKQGRKSVLEVQTKNKYHHVAF